MSFWAPMFSKWSPESGDCISVLSSSTAESNLKKRDVFEKQILKS